MNILVNAASIKEGGPKVVLTRLLEFMPRERPSWNWIVLVNATPKLPGPAPTNLIWAEATGIGRSYVHTLYWYELGLRRLAAKFKPDAFLSLTNYLPRLQVRCPTVLLVQHAGHFSPTFDSLMRQYSSSILSRWMWRQKSRRVQASVSTAKAVTVQSSVLARAIAEQLGPHGTIATIPHGPGIAMRRHEPPSVRATEIFRIGYISKWGVQKDFHTLIAAAAKLKQMGRKFRLVLTLDEGCAEVQQLLRGGIAAQIADCIENHGEVASPDALVALYDSLDVFVFASLCESFGFPMLEAMSRGIPLLVAATPENLEMTGGAARHFPPRDDVALFRLLDEVLADGEMRAAMAKQSLRRSADFSWERAAGETVSLIERVAARA